MIELKVNSGAIQLQEKNLEKLMTDSPEAREAIQASIREVMWEARNATSHEIAGVIGGDRESWRAVRHAVFQKVLGGNINIFDKKRGTAEWKVIQKTRKVEMNPHMRGGNRRKRSLRTMMIEGYEPTARGFILRWQDSGTRQRYAVGRNNFGSRKNNIHYNKLKESGRGNRGQIEPGNFFYRIASKHLGVAAEKLSKMIDNEMAKIYSQNNS